MKIVVLGGCGAMGGIFGGWLKRAGADVTLVDVPGPAVDAVSQNGLSLEEKDGSHTVVAVPATTDPTSVGVADLVINFVKCYHTEAAVRSAMSVIGPDTAVLSLQNGWGNAARIGAVVGPERVLVGLTYHGGTVLGPGRIKHPGIGMTYVGELDGRLTPRLGRIVDVLRGGGFETTASERILDEVWKKLALNCCTLPVAALLRFQSHELVAYDGATDVMAAVLREVVAVANAQGIDLDYGERWSAITGLLEKAVGGKASMLQDVEASRRTEIEVINGAIVEAGRSNGVETPVNDALVSLIGALQSRYLGKA